MMSSMQNEDVLAHSCEICEGVEIDLVLSCPLKMPTVTQEPHEKAISLVSSSLLIN